MKNKKTHPLANAQDIRLDILYGGSEEQILSETMKIAEDAIPSLELEETVLIINSLSNHRRFEKLFYKIKNYEKMSVRGASYAGTKLIQKLPFLEHLIPLIKVRMVILNSFDLAVFNSRHRMQLLEFIKWMRDDMNLRIVIVMNNQPASFGAQGALRLMSSSMMKIGEYAAEKEESKTSVSAHDVDMSGWPLKREPLERSLIEDPRDNGIECTEVESDFVDYQIRECDVPREYSPFSDRENYAPPVPPIMPPSLRNKELEEENVCVAHSGS